MAFQAFSSRSGIGGMIVVRTQRQGDPPVRHRRLRIQFRRASEQARRLVMIETENQRQPLVEELLRHRRFRGNGVTVVAKPFQEFRRLRRTGLVMVVLRLRKGRSHKQDDDQLPRISTHWLVSFRTTRICKVGSTLSRDNLVAKNSV